MVSPQRQIAKTASAPAQPTIQEPPPSSSSEATAQDKFHKSLSSTLERTTSLNGSVDNGDKDSVHSYPDSNPDSVGWSESSFYSEASDRDAPLVQKLQKAADRLKKASEGNKVSEFENRIPKMLHQYEKYVELYGSTPALDTEMRNIASVVNNNVKGKNREWRQLSDRLSTRVQEIRSKGSNGHSEIVPAHYQNQQLSMNHHHQHAMMQPHQYYGHMHQPQNVQILNKVEGEFQVMTEMHTAVQSSSAVLQRMETSVQEQKMAITHLEQAAKTTAHQISEQNNSQNARLGMATGLGVLASAFLNKMVGEQSDTSQVLHRAHCTGAKSTISHWQKTRGDRPWYAKGPEPNLSASDYEYCEMYKPQSPIRLGAPANFALLAIGTATTGWMMHKLGTVLKKNNLGIGRGNKAANEAMGVAGQAARHVAKEKLKQSLPGVGNK